MAGKIPKGSVVGIISNPAGKWYNGAETKWLPNPLLDPELNYRAGIDDLEERHNSDAIVVPEFMNNENQDKSKDYVVYDKNISAEQADQVDEAIKYAWSPAELASADRDLLSEWDVSDADSITEVTGISELRDKLGSNDFVQATPANQPALTNGGTKDALLTFDGVSEYLSQPVNAGNFQDLTRFEWWGVVEVDQISEKDILSFNDNSAGQVNQVKFSIQSDGKAHVGSNDGSITNRGLVTNAALSVGYHIVGYICDGDNYDIIVDNVNVATTPVSPGANDGYFVGGLSANNLIDICSIASRQFTTGGPIYSANKEKHQLCFGGTTDAALSTIDERTNIFNYLNKKHDLGL